VICVRLTHLLFKQVSLGCFLNHYLVRFLV
jgi:hypothetical protein